MKRSQLAVPAVVAGLATRRVSQSRHPSLGTMRVPRTGFLPRGLATLPRVPRVILFAQGLSGVESNRPPDHIPPEGWSRIVFTLAAMTGFAVLLERLGFLLTTFFLMLLLLRAIESQRWSKVFFVALLTAVGSYAL